MRYVIRQLPGLPTQIGDAPDAVTEHTAVALLKLRRGA